MIKNILFDFDGVIADSMPVRDKGFRAIFKDHPTELVEQFIAYHQHNGGLSRYHKIRYFHEEMLGESISDKAIMALAGQFSLIMKDELVDPAIIIKDTHDFLAKTQRKANMHVVSGSDGKELNYLCQALKLDKFFISIEGSPTPKNQLVEDLMQKYGYQHEETILIGDSVNDYEAASVNNIDFFGYNNPQLKEMGKGYIQTFSEPPFAI